MAGGVTVSDDHLGDLVKWALQGADLRFATVKSVQQQLEQRLGLDLSHKLPLIRRHVNSFIDEYVSPDAERWKRLNTPKNKSPDDPYWTKKRYINEIEPEPLPSAFHQKSTRKKIALIPKVFRMSSTLEAIIGKQVLCRDEVVRKLWVYIHQNGLQDANDPDKICCNDALQSLFHVQTLDWQTMDDLLSKHLIPVEIDDKSAIGKCIPSNQPVNKKSKTRMLYKENGNLRRVQISAALQKFLGVCEFKMSRPEVTSRVWDYIRDHPLEDCEDGEHIRCDRNLYELLGCATFSKISLAKSLEPHFLRVCES